MIAFPVASEAKLSVGGQYEQAFKIKGWLCLHYQVKAPTDFTLIVWERKFIRTESVRIPQKWGRVNNVSQEVMNLRNPLHVGDEACKRGNPSWLWNPGQTSPDSKILVSVAPTKRTDVLQKLKKKFPFWWVILYVFSFPQVYGRSSGSCVSVTWLTPGEKQPSHQEELESVVLKPP